MKKINSISGESMFLIANVLVNLGNYGLNVALARMLGPEVFAEANILATMVMILSFVAMGIQLLVAKVSAENTKSDLTGLGWISSMVLRSSIVVTLIMILMAGTCASFLNFDSSLSFFILFSGIPFYFMMSMSRGYYQGSLQFRNLAKSYVVEMIVRSILTVGLLVSLKSLNIGSEIIAIGFLLSFIITYYTSRFALPSIKRVSKLFKTRIAKTIALYSIYELSQILINNSDIILVKHFFDAEDAGLYASVALIGKAIFFGTWIVVTIMFPKVIAAKKNGESYDRLFRISLSLVLLAGLGFTGFCALFGESIMSLAFGSAYGNASPLLWIYALATTMFALGHVFVYYFMSLEKYMPIAISLLFGCVQLLAMWIFHHSFELIIWVQVLMMAVMFLTLGIYYLRDFKLQSTIKKQQVILSNT